MAIERKTIVDNFGFKIYSTNTTGSSVNILNDSTYNEFSCKTLHTDWGGSHLSFTGNNFIPSGVYELTLLVKWVNGFYSSAPNFIINIHQNILSTSPLYAIDNYIDSNNQLLYFSTNRNSNNLISNEYKEVKMIIDFNSKKIIHKSSYFNGNFDSMTFGNLKSSENLVFQIGIASYSYSSDLSIKNISIKRDGQELVIPKSLRIINSYLSLNYDSSSLSFKFDMQKNVDISPVMKIYKNDISDENLLVQKNIGGEYNVRDNSKNI